MFYEVAGWSGTLGPTFQPGWLVGNFGGRSGLFGVSDIGSGTAGGGNPPAPAFPLFGGTGISSGFLLFPTPEPSTATIIAVGAIVLTFFRRKVKPKN
jgi:hypothetical protein